ncbi:hypothetical protein ABC733_17440, partial [Mangrovibacter sp. SLW1]
NQHVSHRILRTHEYRRVIIFRAVQGKCPVLSEALQRGTKTTVPVFTNSVKTWAAKNEKEYR